MQPKVNTIKQFVVDAFTDKVFHGNPAAICILDAWLPDAVMQSIAIENNLSETAFAVGSGENYRLRWFTPGGEIDLCGHATLATGFVLLNYYEKDAEKIVFDTLSGKLLVKKKGDLYEMDFPAYELKEMPVTQAMADAIGETPVAAYMGRDLLCVLKDGNTVPDLAPDMQKVLELDGLLLQVTGPCAKDGYDCVSRSFAPKLSVAEDPVCGSGHCHIVPYWAKKLKKAEIVAFQASRRGGTLYCRMVESRIKMAGKAALFAVSELFV